MCLSGRSPKQGSAASGIFGFSKPWAKTSGRGTDELRQWQIAILKACVQKESSALDRLSRMRRHHRPATRTFHRKPTIEHTESTLKVGRTFFGDGVSTAVGRIVEHVAGAPASRIELSADRASEAADYVPGAAPRQ